MMNIGRICIKTNGRDSGRTCVIIDVIDNKFVLIDGQTRRRKCNIAHLEPMNKTLDIEKNASHDVVISKFKEVGVDVTTKAEIRKKPKASRQQQKALAKPTKEKKTNKKKTKK